MRKLKIPNNPFPKIYLLDFCVKYLYEIVNFCLYVLQFHYNQVRIDYSAELRVTSEQFLSSEI